jgi:geranylgeranylglycerol-phosphate geranylgeranyltransferase
MFVGLAHLTRPLNALITGAAVAIGMSLGGGEAAWFLCIFGPISAMLIAAFANIDNDISDVAIDRINRPGRPLVSGRVSLRAAFFFSLIVLTIGLLSAGVCGKGALIVAGGVAVWLVIYNRWAKRRLLIGNIMVAIAGGLPVVYGGIIAEPAPGHWRILWLGFALAAAFHLARELLKDIQDVTGDRAAGARTVPIVLGITAATRLSGVYLSFIALFSIIPAILLWLNAIYLWGIIALIAIPSTIACLQLWRKPTPHEAGKWAEITKAMMVVGIVLLWLAAP